MHMKLFLEDNNLNNLHDKIDNLTNFFVIRFFPGRHACMIAENYSLKILKSIYLGHFTLKQTSYFLKYNI
jgi:hypothetical protein